MRVSETCSCGATFEADDGHVSQVASYTTARDREMNLSADRSYAVEEQARRWRVEHHHQAPVTQPTASGRERHDGGTDDEAESEGEVKAEG